MEAELIAPTKAPMPEMDKKRSILEELLDRVMTAPKMGVGKKPTKKKEWESKKSSYSWAKYVYGGEGKKLQNSGQSRKNRFPVIFDRLKVLQPDAKRVLSFGCSVGHETEALAERFPDAEIVGMDIDHYSIQQARRNNKRSNVCFVDELAPCGKFDVVAALQVFFALECEVPKKRWLEAMEKLDKHVAPGGVVIVYTSDYPIEEVLTPEKYEPISVWTRKHNRRPSGKDYWNGYFRKR